MILKYTGSSKRFLHQHWVERDGLDLFDDTSRIHLWDGSFYVLELKTVFMIFGITVETLR